MPAACLLSHRPLLRVSDATPIHLYYARLQLDALPRATPPPPYRTRTGGDVPPLPVRSRAANAFRVARQHAWLPALPDLQPPPVIVTLPAKYSSVGRFPDEHDVLLSIAGLVFVTIRERGRSPTGFRLPFPWHGLPGERRHCGAAALLHCLLRRRHHRLDM